MCFVLIFYITAICIAFPINVKFVVESNAFYVRNIFVQHVDKADIVNCVDDIYVRVQM